MNTELMKHVEDFDNGKKVKTVVMGAISDSYEIAIQKLAIEIMRILMLIKIPEEAEDFATLIDIAEKSAMENVDGYGYSGAQSGAAKNIAAMYYRHTPPKALSMVTEPGRVMTMYKDESGTVRISKHFDEKLK